MSAFEGGGEAAPGTTTQTITTTHTLAHTLTPLPDTLLAPTVPAEPATGTGAEAEAIGLPTERGAGRRGIRWAEGTIDNTVEYG